MNRFSKCILLSLIAILCVTTIYFIHRVHVSRDPYSIVENYLLCLNRTRNARTIRVGKSAGGRTIYAVVLADKVTSGANARPLILFLSGQHGNETTPVYSMISMISELCAGNRDYRQILQRVTVVFVPVVNPDGFSSCNRFNKNGIDLNRDWNAATQPETRSVTSLVRRLHPSVIVDEHEGLPFTVEISRYGSPKQRRLTETIAALAAGKTGHGKRSLRPSLNSGKLNADLVHRHFAKQGICSMLVETPGDDRVDERERVYKAFSYAVIRIFACHLVRL